MTVTAEMAASSEGKLHTHLPALAVNIASAAVRRPARRLGAHTHRTATAVARGSSYPRQHGGHFCALSRGGAVAIRQARSARGIVL